MNTPTFHSVVDKFPLSICKVWYKDGITHYHNDFAKSIVHKTIYLTNAVYNDKDKYVNKILTKFPNYKYSEVI